MAFFTWGKKLLKVKGKFAVSEKCCCKGHYCVLTRTGQYECRDARPAADSGDQVLSEHKTDSECQKVCYERYYCYREEGKASECLKEGDLPNGTDDPLIIGGPYRKSECESSCTTCPPCANEACVADREGDVQPYNDCCATHSEVWEYDGDGWVLKTECAEGGMCVGTGEPPFPDDPELGDEHTFDCAPSGKDPPKDNEDCDECKFKCVPVDPDEPDGEKECKRDANGDLTQKKCDEKCLGQWHCVATDKCERQQNPDPESQGYDTEEECLDAAPVDCAKNYWYCETSDRCVNRAPEEGEPDGYDTEDECVDNAPTDCPAPPPPECVVDFDCSGWGVDTYSQTDAFGNDINPACGTIPGDQQFFFGPDALDKAEAEAARRYADPRYAGCDHTINSFRGVCCAGECMEKPGPGCEVPAGACCNENTGVCFESLEAQCAGPEVVWLGPNTTCDGCKIAEPLVTVWCCEKLFRTCTPVTAKGQAAAEQLCIDRLGLPHPTEQLCDVNCTPCTEDCVFCPPGNVPNYLVPYQLVDAGDGTKRCCGEGFFFDGIQCSSENEFSDNTHPAAWPIEGHCCGADDCQRDPCPDRQV